MTSWSHAGTSEVKHLTTLDEVPSRLEGAGLRLKCNKCMCIYVAICGISIGHKISAEDLQLTQSAWVEGTSNQRSSTTQLCLTVAIIPGAS